MIRGAPGQEEGYFYIRTISVSSLAAARDDIVRATTIGTKEIVRQSLS